MRTNEGTQEDGSVGAGDGLLALSKREHERRLVAEDHAVRAENHHHGLMEANELDLVAYGLGEERREREGRTEGEVTWRWYHSLMRESTAEKMSQQKLDFCSPLSSVRTVIMSCC